MIDSAWQKYLAMVMPGNAGKVQIEETRRGFYAGALAVFNGLLSLEGDETDLAKLDQLKAELDAYCESVRADEPRS